MMHFTAVRCVSKTTGPGGAFISANQHMRDPEFQDHPDLPLPKADADSVPPSNVWQRLSRVMEVVIFVLLGFAVYKLFGPEIDRRAELQSEVNRLSAIVEEKEEIAGRLSTEHRLLKTDKEYLETVARDRLNLQREGEYIIRIESGEEED